MTAAATAQDGGSMGGLVLPDNPEFFTKNDPNLRKATVIVNGEIITGTDVDQRVALIVNASGGKVSPDELTRLKMQVLRNLMDETLQIQEAKAQKVEVENSEVDQTFARIAQQNFGQDAKAMEAYLAKVGSSSASLKRQIRGELSWNRLLRRNVQPFVNVSDEEVREVLKRMQDAKGTEEYRVGEIFLSATSETRDAVYQNAMKIVEQLKEGGSFVGYARQFSEASTAATGGDLGWVKRGVLPTELDALLPTVQSGQLVGPVEIRGGFSILLLIDKRQVLTADPRDALLSLKQISIGFAPGVTETQATARAKAFADAMAGARGCANADEVAASLGADVVNNDQIKARDLPTPLQNLVLSLNLGETTPPFGSIQEGVRVLMLCGRDDPKADTGPDFEQVQTQMEDERVNKRAQTYLRDLRRDAVIDYN
ncbi:MAG: peptidylprolyl isomerase [Novosphingobium sp.]|nr:peptidylprolyl isomerase [Novosphingobium sp.]MDP3907246.1 peptidylprolyl isomerase [Novosphingobium sp.]